MISPLDLPQMSRKLGLHPWKRAPSGIHGAAQRGPTPNQQPAQNSQDKITVLPLATETISSHLPTSGKGWQSDSSLDSYYILFLSLSLSLSLSLLTLDLDLWLTWSSEKRFLTHVQLGAPFLQVGPWKRRPPGAAHVSFGKSVLSSHVTPYSTRRESLESITTIQYWTVH